MERPQRHKPQSDVLARPQPRWRRGNVIFAFTAHCGGSPGAWNLAEGDGMYFVAGDKLDQVDAIKRHSVENYADTVLKPGVRRWEKLREANTKLWK